jgi:hypothetical protein
LNALFGLRQNNLYLYDEKLLSLKLQQTKRKEGIEKKSSQKKKEE